MDWWRSTDCGGWIEIDFNEVLDGDELFDFALVGDGKGGDFDLLQQGLIARDANGEVITEGSPVSLDGEVAGNGTNYLEGSRSARE